MVLVIGNPGSFAKEEAKGVELKKAIILCQKSYMVSTIIYLNSHIPHASKSENMKASKSFMIFNFSFTFYFTFSANFSGKGSFYWHWPNCGSGPRFLEFMDFCQGKLNESFP